jgi:hypothetical protein
MEILDKESVQRLASVTQGPCVSLYMPTARTSPDARQGQIRMKNLARQAAQALAEHGLAPAVAEEVTAVLDRIVLQMPFWTEAADGLAVFTRPGEAFSFRLPVSFPERVAVGDRFVLKPLVGILSGDESYLLLTLSQKGVRLYRGSRSGLAEIHVENMPGSLEEVLNYDGFERRAQAGTLGGHGTGDDRPKEDIVTYFRRIVEVLSNAVKGAREPLILAGVEYLHPLYRSVSRYHKILPAGITGNAEKLSPEQLHAQAWPLVSPIFEKAKADAMARYLRDAGTGLTGKDPEEVFWASKSGRVEAVFLVEGAEKWASVDPMNMAATPFDGPGPGREDLLETIALETFLKEGKVFVLPQSEMPNGGPVAAVYRY